MHGFEETEKCYVGISINFVFQLNFSYEQKPIVLVIIYLVFLIIVVAKNETNIRFLYLHRTKYCKDIRWLHRRIKKDAVI